MLYPDFAELLTLQAASARGISQQHRSHSTTAGDYSSLFHGQGMEFDSVRSYIPGDDIRYIDWRVTARTHKPHVKTFQAECDRKIMLVVDSNSYMRFGTRGTFKSIQAARATAILAGMGAQNRDRIGGFVFGDIAMQTQFFPPSRVRATFTSCLKLLCQPAVIGSAIITLAAALEQLKNNLAHGSIVFVITDVAAILATDIKLLAEIQARNRVILLPIIDPIDEALPELDHLICTNNAKQEIKINATSRAMRNKYQELWQAEQQQLQILVQQYQFKLITLYTNKTVQQSIYAGLQQQRSY